MVPMVKVKSLSDNLNAQFDEVHRSSAIFWIPPISIASSTISILNYYTIKNNCQTKARLTWRLFNGTIVKTDNIDWSSFNVLNASTPDELLNCGGSVEFEAFSDQNLRIPYSAVMCIYETTKSVAFVHSYSRIYNENEDEASLESILHREGCWTLKDTSFITSSAVFHNGPNELNAQKANLTITNSLGKQLSASIPIPKLNPYETYLLTPKEYFCNLEEFLGGELGSAKINFITSGAFGRMLLIWSNQSEKLLTVTHSNFNYSECTTDTLHSSEELCYARVPQLSGIQSSLILYRDHTNNAFDYTDNTITRSPKDIDYYSPLVNEKVSQTVSFSPLTKESLPSRIVTGFLSPPDSSGNLGFECSFGVMNAIYKPKRFHWACVIPRLKSKIILSIYTELFDEPSDDTILNFSLYLPTSKDPIVAKVKLACIDQQIFVDGLEVNKLFPQNTDLSNTQDACYITLFAEYGGFVMFSTLEKENSFALEHSF